MEEVDVRQVRKMPDSELRTLIAARRLSRLGCGRVSDERIRYVLQPGFEAILAAPLCGDLCALWVAAARDGGFSFQCVFPPDDDVFLYASDSFYTARKSGRLAVSERFDELRAAAYAGGVESLVDAYMSGVPLDDLMAGVDGYVV
jgi:hypothetical protein